MQTVMIRERKKWVQYVKMALLFSVFFAALWMTVFTRHSLAAEAKDGISLPPAEQSMAWKQYQLQPKSELTKINYLFSRFSHADAEVIYDGHEYKMPEAIQIARKYFLNHYNKESAEYWVKNYCYKSDAGNLIILRGKNGAMVPARDAVLQELMRVQSK